MHTYTGRINKKISKAQYSCWHLGDNHKVLKKQALTHSMLFFRATVGIWGPSCMPSCRFCTEWLLGSIQHSHWHRIPEWTRNKNATSQGLARKPMKALKALMFPCLAAFKKTKKQQRPRFPDVEGNINACRKCIAAKKRRRQSSTFEACAPWQHSHQHWPHCQTSSRARVTSKSCLYGGWPKFLLPEMAILGKKYFRETPQKKNPPHPILDYEWKYAWQTNRT